MKLNKIGYMFAVSVWLAATPISDTVAQDKVEGSVQAAHRGFQDVITGPKARIFAGLTLTVKVNSGQADINYIHRENRKCKWYGKCWYERWVDHNFKSPPSNMWPIDYRLIDENGDVHNVQNTTESEFQITVPKSATEYNKSFKLQARFANNPQPIDANRTNGVFGFEVSFDPSERIKSFPDYLNNGTFLPRSPEIERMLQLDVWTREKGKVELSNALVNYARVFFPSDDDLESTEHYKLLEIAQGLDPESDSVSRALVDYYVNKGDFSNASDEIRSQLKDREEQLKGDPNDRQKRLELAQDYAFLAALTEREGTLLTPQEYKRVDSLYDRAVRHAKRGNSREILSRILASRSTILRKSNTDDGLARAIKAQTEVVKLQGQLINGNVVSVSPDKRFALISKARASTGIINQPIESVRTDQMLQSTRIEHPNIPTKRGLTPLAVGSSGEILIDDGGILSLMTLGAEGNFLVEPIDNVSFESASFYDNGYFGISRDANDNNRFSFLPIGQSLESIPFGEDNSKIPSDSQSKLSEIFNFSSSKNSNMAVVIGKEKSPHVRAFRIIDTQAEEFSIENWDLLKTSVEMFEVSPNGSHLAAFVRRNTGTDEAPVDTPFIDIVPLDGGDVISYSQAQVEASFNLEEIEGITFSKRGNILGVLTKKYVLSFKVPGPDVGTLEAVVKGTNDFDVIPELFGLDNEGALIAAAEVPGKNSGFIFRTPYDEDAEEFSQNSRRIKVANRILRAGNVVVLARDGKINVGIPRHNFGNFAVIDLTSGTTTKFAGRAVHYDTTRLLAGGRHIVSVDELSNSVIIHDLERDKELPPINPAVDLGNNIEDEGVKLKPYVVPLETYDDWILVWIDRRDSSVKSVSKYNASSKQGATLFLDQSHLSGVSDEITKTLQSEQVAALNLGPEPNAKFELSYGIIGSENNLPLIPLISVSHRLVGINPLDTLSQLDSSLGGPIDFPIVDLTAEKLKIDKIKSERFGRIIGFDKQSGSVLMIYGKQLKLRTNTAPVVDIVPTNIFGPDDNKEKIEKTVFVPNYSTNGNLAGANVAFLMTNNEGRTRVDYKFFNTDGSEATPCNFCNDHGSLQKVVRGLDISDLVGMVDTSKATYSLPINNKLVLFSRKSGNYPVDELPLGRVTQLSESARHVIRTISGTSQLFVPSSD